MFGRLSGWLLSVARGVGQLLGNELDVVVTEHEIKLEMVDPSELDSEGRCWDDSMFTEGNIHLEGIANPIKPQAPSEDSETDYITSDRYQTFMENKLIDDIIDQGTSSSGLTLLHALVIIVTVQLSMTGVILWFVL